MFWFFWNFKDFFFSTFFETVIRISYPNIERGKKMFVLKLKKRKFQKQRNFFLEKNRKIASSSFFGGK
jgi:hypothetical protein